MDSVKLTILLFFCLMSNMGYAQISSDSQLIRGFDRVLSEQVKSDEPGVVALVSRNGEVIYKKAFGMANMELNVPMQEDNVFWIASITKQFTAVAILQLMEKGKLSLQDEITKYIPDYPTQGNTITIEHLLTHTSGIQNFSGMEDPDKKLALEVTPNEVIDFFKNHPMRFVPGSSWEYSNSGYFLLGYIIEVITGKPYSAYLEENFFEPLGMTHSLYANDKKIIKNRVDTYSYGQNGFENSLPRNITHVYSAGGIQSTVEDLFKWNQAVHSYKLVSKETIEKAFKRYKLTNGMEVDYGYGWRLGYVYESPSIWHGGLISGIGAIELYLPEEDIFVAVFSNCDCRYPRETASILASMATGKVFDFEEIPLSNSILTEYPGVYENTKGQQLIITLSGNQLYSQVGRGPKNPLKAHQKDMFFFESDRLQLIEFSRNKQAQVEKVTTKKLNGNEIWNKTDQPIPDENGIKVDEKVLLTYVGDYEIPSVFTFSVSHEKGRLYLQAEGQEKFEMYADTQSNFFLKVNDAEIEFVRDDIGKVVSAILNQGGRQAEARKIK